MSDSWEQARQGYYDASDEAIRFLNLHGKRAIHETPALSDEYGRLEANAQDAADTWAAEHEKRQSALGRPSDPDPDH